MSGEARAFVWGMLTGCLIFFAGFVCGRVSAQDVVPTPRAAIGWAAEHLAQQHDRANWRYLVADPWADPDWAAAVTVGLNTAINREPVPYRPLLMANGWMIGVNFGLLVSDPVERAKVLAVWDGMAVDEPYFHVPRVNSGLSVPVVASHLPQEHVEIVVAWSEQANRHGVVPIYRAGWALSQMLSAHEGRFYQLRGTSKGNPRASCPTCQGRRALKLTSTGRTIPCPDCSGGGSDEDRWLAKWGLSTAKSATFRGDLRKGMIQSQVTGFPRGALAVQGFVGRGWITEDVLGNDPTKHPIHSLLPGPDGKLASDAKEDIVEMPSGFHDFALFNGKEELQTLAVLEGLAVRDTTVPVPHPPLLQPAISCIRCHWMKDFDLADQKYPAAGLHPVANDVQTILAPQLGGDVLGSDAELSRLAGLYAGSHLFDQSLQLGRARLAVAVQQATAGIVPNKPQGLTVQEGGLAVMSLYNRYRYPLVDAAMAIQELGETLEADENAAERLALLIGKATDNPDATALALLRGLGVRREDWERVYHDLYLRAESTRASK